MPARLTVYPAHRPTQVWSLIQGAEYVIGRDLGEPAVERATADDVVDIAVDDDRISRRHAILHGVDDNDVREIWQLRDDGSKNGIELDGRPVVEATLSDDTWISLGGVLARFQVLGPGDLEADRGSRVRRWQTSAAHQRALEPSLGVEPLLERLLDSVLELSGTDRGFVLAAESPGRTSAGDRRAAENDLAASLSGLTVAATRGVEPSRVSPRAFLGSSGVVQRVLTTLRPTACSDATAETWLGARASVLDGGIRALACLPLVTEGRLLGVVYADSREPGATVTELDLEVLSALADHAALALSVARIDREIDGLIHSLADVQTPHGGIAAGTSSADLMRRLAALRPGHRASPTDRTG